MKKLLTIIALIVVFAMALTACGGGGGGAGTDNTGGTKGETTQPAADGKTYTIRIGTPTGGKHQQNITMEEFKTRIEKESNGRIVAELYPTSQLGTAVQMIQGVQDGSIQAVLIPSSYYASFAPAMAVLDLPFLFKGGSDEAYEILNSDENPLFDYLYQKGFYAATWLRCANRYLLANKEVKTMSDLKNLKVWCLPSPTLQKELELYGASPASLDPGDIAGALQNKTVDAVSTDPTFYFTMKLYENAKFINKIPGSAMTNTFIFSVDWLESIPGDLKDLIISTAKAVVSEVEYDYMGQFEQTAMNAMTDAGVKVVEPSDQLLAELKAASAPLHESFKATDADCARIYDAFVQLINK